MLTERNNVLKFPLQVCCWPKQLRIDQFPLIFHLLARPIMLDNKLRKQVGIIVHCPFSRGYIINVPVWRATIAVDVKRISRVHFVLPSPLALARHADNAHVLSMIYEHKLL